MVNIVRRYFAVIFLFIAILFFYSPFLFTIFQTNPKLPIPTDTIVGLYHPFRDFYSSDYPNGIPFKNFLITDPVRQTYIWRELALDILQNGSIPSWNPYEMTGKPLLANFQSGVLYPFNLLLLLKPFAVMWSILIMSQSILTALFMYLYLRNLKLSSYAATLGAAAFTFSGFSIAWLEWGSIGSTALWLPLILLAIDKIGDLKKKVMIFSRIRLSSSILWSIVYFLGLWCSFSAGHLQTFVYVYLISIGYAITKILVDKKSILINFLSVNAAFILTSALLWIPTLVFLMNSARSSDQSMFTSEGWFLPYSHFAQFFAPDFFGNPSTLNYWGTWNYGELVGFIGVAPLLLAFYGFNKRLSLFFGASLLLSLLFATSNPIARLPFILEIPFLSTAQPTRLLFVATFSLSVLSAIGFSSIAKAERYKWKMIIPVILTSVVFGLLWIIAIVNIGIGESFSSNYIVAQRNLFFPSVVFGVSVVLIFLLVFIKKKFREIVMVVLLLITFMELLRFGQKFTPFVSSQYLYPTTKVIQFLKEDHGIYRVAVTDRRILPPNFLTHYKIQTIEGYDPLYLSDYAEYVVVMARNKPDVSRPFGFNRIITPNNYSSPLFDFLNTKYVLSLDELISPKLVKIMEEGATKLYLNKNVVDRAFFVERVILSNDTVKDLFKYDLQSNAVIEQQEFPDGELSKGTAAIVKYHENSIEIKTNNAGDGFLVVSDAYYPTWNVYVDGKKQKIYKTNHAFRGVFVPKGMHTVKFKNDTF